MAFSKGSVIPIQTTISDVDTHVPTSGAVVDYAATVGHSHSLLGDGDKGDVTVGGSGTTLTIDAEAVSYAKMQHVSANKRVLGNVSGAAGDVAEIPIGTGANEVAEGNHTHSYIPTAEKAAASGVASLDGSSLVVQNPANATATPTGSKIPIAGAGGTLDKDWLPAVSTSAKGACPILDNDNGHFLSGQGNWVHPAQANISGLTTASDVQFAKVGAGLAPTYPLDIFGLGAGNHVVARLQNEGASTHTGLVMYNCTNNSAYKNVISGYRAVGTDLDSLGNCAAGDAIVGFLGLPYIDGAYRSACSFDFFVGASPGASSYPTYFSVSTTNTGGTSRSERIRVSEAGYLGVMTAAPTSYLDVGGSFGTYIKYRTSDLTITEIHHTLLVNTGSSTDKTMSLPTNAAGEIAGREYMFIKMDSGTKTIIIDGYGTETINGATTQAVSGQYGKIKIKAADATSIAAGGSNWYIVNT